MEQPASSRRHPRWACPLGCDAGFMNIPQTNEHLKKSHMAPRKGEEQGSITPDQMDQVRDVTKRHRLKTDLFKMKQIHKIFKEDVADEDLEIYAANRDNIRRMAVACGQGHHKTKPIMATFKRLCVRGNPHWASMFPNDQALELHLTQTCQLIPHFLSALGIDGSPEIDGEPPHQASASETEPTSMHPSSSRDPSRPLATGENMSLNANSQVNVSHFNDGYGNALDGSTIVGGSSIMCDCELAKLRLVGTRGIPRYALQTPKDIPAEWNPNCTLNMPGDSTNFLISGCPPLNYAAQNFNPVMAPFTKAHGAGASFDPAMARDVWIPNPPPEYRQAQQIDGDLVNQMDTRS